MEGIKRGLTGSTLKWIAIVTMFIDHIGATVLTRMLLNYPYDTSLLGSAENYTTVYWIMRSMRTVGRLAFPIFCFLLVEGFQRTSNRTGYVLRMAGFAVITEIPFDLVFSGKIIEWSYQNVMLTLLIGMITMWGCSLIEKRFIEKKPALIVGVVLCTGLGMVLAQVMHTDYAAKGIACIMVLYFFRKDKMWQALMGAASFYWEVPAMISFLFIHLYNGQRGMKMKYFFYAFYPLHLIALYLVCYAMGIHWISVI